MSATITIPVVTGQATKNTMRLFEMLKDGTPHSVQPGGTSVWFWKELLALAGVDTDSDKPVYAVVTVEFRKGKPKPGVLIDNVPVAKVKAEQAKVAEPEDADDDA